MIIEKSKPVASIDDIESDLWTAKIMDGWRHGVPSSDIEVRVRISSLADTFRGRRSVRDHGNRSIWLPISVTKRAKETKKNIHVYDPDGIIMAVAQHDPYMVDLSERYARRILAESEQGWTGFDVDSVEQVGYVKTKVPLNIEVNNFNFVRGQFEFLVKGKVYREAA